MARRRRAEAIVTQVDSTTFTFRSSQQLYIGAIDVEDLARWPSDSDGVGFLSPTTSTVSTEQLIQVGCNFL